MMPMYAVATVFLIVSLSESVRQVWYADDDSALGLLKIFVLDGTS